MDTSFTTTSITDWIEFQTLSTVSFKPGKTPSSHSIILPKFINTAIANAIPAATAATVPTIGNIAAPVAVNANCIASTAGSNNPKTATTPPKTTINC